jgi:hypothetical protein
MKLQWQVSFAFFAMPHSLNFASLLHSDHSAARCHHRAWKPGRATRIFENYQLCQA